MNTNQRFLLACAAIAVGVFGGACGGDVVVDQAGHGTGAGTGTGGQGASSSSSTGTGVTTGTGLRCDCTQFCAVAVSCNLTTMGCTLLCESEDAATVNCVCNAGIGQCAAMKACFGG